MEEDQPCVVCTIIPNEDVAKFISDKRIDVIEVSAMNESNTIIVYCNSIEWQGD